MLDKGHEGLDPEVSAFGRCGEVLDSLEGMGFIVSLAIPNLNQLLLAQHGSAGSHRCLAR